jgi:hypothetical protein
MVLLVLELQGQVQQGLIRVNLLEQVHRVHPRNRNLKKTRKMLLT